MPHNHSNTWQSEGGEEAWIYNHPDEAPDSQETKEEVAVKQGMATVVKQLQEALLPEDTWR